MYKCTFCGKDFFFNGQLNRHIEYTHKKEIIKELDLQPERDSINTFLRAHAYLEEADQSDIDCGGCEAEVQLPNIYGQWLTAQEAARRYRGSDILTSVGSSSFGNTPKPTL